MLHIRGLSFEAYQPKTHLSYSKRVLHLEKGLVNVWTVQAPCNALATAPSKFPALTLPRPAEATHNSSPLTGVKHVICSQSSPHRSHVPKVTPYLALLALQGATED